MTVDAAAAPGLDPGAVGLPWWRRSVRQGLGYMAPSSAFVFTPPIFSWGHVPWGQWWLTLAIGLLIGAFFLGTSLVMHWPEWARWLWLSGLIASIVSLGLFHEDTRPTYFGMFITTTTAVLIAWRHARTVIVAASVLMAGLSLLQEDMFGLVMAMMALTLGLSIGLGMESESTRRKLKVAEERTAVLAVAAERERIARDLHDILGHSLTSIAVKADLVGRLIGRDDAAASDEVAGLGAVARQALADVRATASGMRKVRLATEIAAARSVLTAAGVEAVTPTALPALSDESSELLGYVVREAVTNVVRHADATTCTISIGPSSITISDDGRGFDQKHGGSGLAGLRARLEAAGGTLEVTSANGTTVHAKLPAPAEVDN